MEMHKENQIFFSNVVVNPFAIDINNLFLFTYFILKQIKNLP